MLELARQTSRSMKSAVFVTLWISLMGSSSASDLFPLSQSQAKLFATMHLVFPDEKGGHPILKNSTPWQIRVWEVNEADECTYGNTHSDCKGDTLYISVAEDQLGGKLSAYKTGKSYKWEIVSISFERFGGGCALVSLTSKELARDKNKIWNYRRVEICLTPDGVVDR